MEAKNLEVAAIAIERSDGRSFEKFAQALFADILGYDFVPLGGTGDGGADGFIEVFESRNSHFVQITRQEDHRAKIRHTVKRLRQVGRTPTRLTYISALIIPKIDLEQELLGDELGIGIQIRDQNYILLHLNKSHPGLAAFESYMSTYVGHLYNVGAASIFSRMSTEHLRTAVVFLSQELENRDGGASLSHKIVDSLIIWALRNTNPENLSLMTKKQIFDEIVAVLPAARQIISGAIENRLKVLSSKSHPSGRQINIYPKSESYCLPFETRKTVQVENASDELLRNNVSTGFAERARTISIDRGFEEIDCDFVGSVCLSAIERAFQDQGLKIAKSVLENAAIDTRTFVEVVTELVSENGLKGEIAVRTADVALTCIRFAFYASTELERRIFNRWSRTYALLLQIQNEPRIVEWMKESTTRFHLFVGSDVLIRALSEQFLHKEDRLASNALEILSASKSVLVLAEPVLDEVYTHIVASDNEFRNHYLEQEPYLTIDFVQACARPLIRTYLYAKMRPFKEVAVPRNWATFIDGIMPYRSLHKSEGKNGLKQYLIEHFKMEFDAKVDLVKLVDSESLKDLSDRFVPIKHQRGENAKILAENDALMVLAVYGKRNSLGEAHKPNPLGYRVWWLTNETFIRQATGDIVNDHGSSYMLRPEYIMQYIALNPKMDAIRKSYANIFPSTLSISLGARVDDQVLHSMLNRLKISEGYNEARLKVEAAALSNRLMSDFGRKYNLIGV